LLLSYTAAAITGALLLYSEAGVRRRRRARVSFWELPACPPPRRRARGILPDAPCQLGPVAGHCAGEFFVLAEHAGSFDSRHIGTMQARNIIGRVVPVRSHGCQRAVPDARQRSEQDKDLPTMVSKDEAAHDDV
jgi:hypothetical protein